MKYQILSTKKLSAELSESFSKSLFTYFEKEFITIKPIRSKQKIKDISSLLNKTNAPIVITSQNAIHAIESILPETELTVFENKLFFCLSGKTKNTLLKLLPGSLISASAENATTLAEKIVDFAPKDIIFFCGNKRRDELPVILAKNNITVNEILVYNTKECPHVITQKLDGILFFSPTAVDSFFILNKLSEHTVCFAIGKTTEEAISKITSNKVITSDLPELERIVEKVKMYFQYINNQNV